MSGPDAVIEIWGNADERILVTVEGLGHDRARAALEIGEGEVVEAELVVSMPQ